MIDKLTGRTAYAILSFGGLLGIGANHYPIPCSMLTYNEKPDGFQLDVAEEPLKNAAKIEQGESWEQAKFMNSSAIITVKIMPKTVWKWWIARLVGK
jgi:hypothetical protein